MADGAQTNGSQTGWMSDVQRAIALILIGTFALLCFISTFVVVWNLDKLGLADMAKTLQAALVNMALIALGFFFGNTMAKMAQDASTQRTIEKITPTAPVPPPPVVVPVPPWWARLTDAEKNTITTEGPNDPRVAAFITASQAGAANADDLAYLVSKNLLTQTRADDIQKA